MLKSRILFVAVLYSSVLFGQTDAQKSKYESASNLIVNNYVSVKWGDKQAHYIWQDGADKVLYSVDLRNGKKTVVAQESTLKKQLLALEPTAEALLPNWSLSFYDVDAKGDILFKFNKKSFRYDVKSHVLQSLEEPKPSATASSNRGNKAVEYWKKFNSDSTKYIFGKGHQLYVFDSKKNKEFKLSTDGEPNFSYNNNNITDVDTSKYTSTSATWLGNQIVAWREDRRNVGEMSVINSLTEPRPSLRTYKFPMPGDTAVSRFDVRVWDASTLVPSKVDIITEKDQRLILPGQLVNGRTSLFADRLGANDSFVYFLRRNRANDVVELCKLEFPSLKVSVLIRETTTPHINEQLFTVHALKDKGILFWSERSGYGQYYHYSNAGKLLNKVGPKGNYVVSRIVEELDKDLILEVYGFNPTQNPYYKQYLNASIASEKGVLLTPEHADHQIAFSDDKKFVLNTFSTITTPHQFTIRNVATGKLVTSIGVSTIDQLKAIGWSAPEEIKVKAADDSTWLYGLLYKPQDFDASKKYPIISTVYPGPQEDFVPQSFTIDDNYHQSLADLGFLVYQLPSRGSSPYRGLKFHSYSHGNMRDYALADNKKTIEDLAKDRSYVDLNKVGIFGHSGGGFMTATAMMTHPEFYKVGVAASGNYDPNIYTQWWGETYHGVNTTAKATYIPTTLELAPNLKGKLLLITGDVDINVHPAHTFRLANALIKSGKFFDMMVLPGKDHGLGDWYYQSLIRNYFLSHLK